MRNTYSQVEFELRYQNMLMKYESCQPYLENKLYSSQASWVKYSITKVFTAGVKSIQCVESILEKEVY